MDVVRNRTVQRLELVTALGAVIALASRWLAGSQAGRHTYICTYIWIPWLSMKNSASCTGRWHRYGLPVRAKCAQPPPPPVRFDLTRSGSKR